MYLDVSTSDHNNIYLTEMFTLLFFSCLFKFETFQGRLCVLPFFLSSLLLSSPFFFFPFLFPFFFLFLRSSQYIAQTGLKLLVSRDRPASVAHVDYRCVALHQPLCFVSDSCNSLEVTQWLMVYFLLGSTSCRYKFKSLTTKFTPSSSIKAYADWV